MPLRKTHKAFIIVVLSVLVVSVLPGVAAIWAEADSDLAEADPSAEPLIPPPQGDEPITRPPSSFGDMIVQFGEGSGDISTQSDNSGVEIVPGAAFVHTNELGSGSEAEDWFFSFAGGYLTNDSVSHSGISKSVCLMAPVYLPLDSTIIGFSAYVLDQSSTIDVAIFLDRTRSHGGWTELAAVQSTGSSTSIQTLTDPSIFADGDANVVALNHNYHVSLCLPAGSDFDIRVFGARVDYIPFGTPPPAGVHLPIIFKADPTLLMSYVYITNLSGGSVDYTIQGTPQGNIHCVVPNGAENQYCDKPFTSGTYNWTAQLHCGSLGPKPKEFNPGPVHPTAFRCD